MTTTLTPEEALEQYLESRHDATASTVTNHRYRLNYFLQWFDEESELDDLSALSGLHCEQFKNWRMTNFDLNLVTLQYHMQTLRVFVRWCENVGVIDEEVSDKIIVPTVPESEKARDVHISHDRATQIMDYLARYEWASKNHLVFSLLYHTGMRRSSLYSLDVQDWHQDNGYLAVRHRPEQGTSLKLKEDGERNVSVTNNRLARALDDWLEEQRPDVVDDSGRHPLLASTQGRLHYETISKVCYRVVRPCYFANECPHDRDIDDCQATKRDHMSKCPGSVSSHPIRRSAITHHLDSDVPKAIVSERMNVSEPILDMHYDARDKEQRRLNRAKYLDSV
ncbi:tyrosine-type recombinase/integrase [Halococcus salsus]|uniref:tyrosine-type recombinase/integrase n=1 Tax=Halococcus salsus TaxID=2162894 RepID=UPI001359B435|nr:site-specific integrase [Halococcus salsus]